MGRKIKFAGSADDRTLLKGDSFGGQLATPLTKDVRFDASNNWVVDADEAELSDAAVGLMLASGDFWDVSDKEVIPNNRFQQIFQSRPAPEVDPSEEVAELVEATVPTGTADETPDPALPEPTPDDPKAKKPKG